MLTLEQGERASFLHLTVTCLPLDRFISFHCCHSPTQYMPRTAWPFLLRVRFMYRVNLSPLRCWAQELCRTAWALGRLGLGGIFGPGSVVDGGGGGGGESEDGGYGSALDGGEMSGLMDKLLRECSKWLEIFTPQVCTVVCVWTLTSRLASRARVRGNGRGRANP